MKGKAKQFFDRHKAAICLGVFVLVLAIYALIFQQTVRRDAKHVSAEKGYMVCPRIDNHVPVSLCGEWEYYPGKMLFSSDFDVDGRSRDGYEPEYVQVPGEAPNQTGFGTYRLRFRLITGKSTFAFKTCDIWSSARIFLDGVLICSIGDPSIMTNGSLPWNSAMYVTVNMDIYHRTHELIVQTSNYSYLTHGIVAPIYFGTQLSVYDMTNTARLTEAIGAMSVLILAALALSLLAMRIQIRNLPWLMCFSLLLGCFLLLNGEKLLLNIFPAISFTLFCRVFLLLHLAMFLSMGLYACDFGETGRRSMRLANGMVGLSAVAMLVLALAPQPMLRVAFLGCIVMCALWAALTAFHMVRKILRNEATVLLQLLAFLNWLGIFLTFKLFYQGRLYAASRESLLLFCTIGFVIFQLVYVAQRVAGIYSANEHLAQRMLVSDKLKSELMAIVSHELRTPLHGIININQSVIRNIQQDSGLESNKQIEDLNLTLSLAHRMSGIVGNLYDFVEQNDEEEITLRPVNLRVEVNAVFEMFHYTGANPALHFVNQIPASAPEVYADENKLWQVLSNLVNNAIKYTRAGAITVNSQMEGDMVAVTVTDTGIGMDTEKTDFIFERYARLSNADLQASGSGLGLYIARRQVEQMGGTIRVQWSEPNVGTCICFTLKPCPENLSGAAAELDRPAVSESVDAAAHAMLPICPASARLLIADDNPVNRRVVASIFQDCNFDIDYVSDGDEAIALVKEHGLAYDVVLLDVMMPRMSGFEACRIIRSQYSHFDLPVLMLTARDQIKDIVTGFWVGANDYVTKPADSLELRARVFTLINLRQSVSAAIDNELSFLQAQIRPHFLYNAFNTISAIALSDGNAASELIDDLGVYLRSIFKDNAGDDTLIPLAREIDTIQAYLRIEKARFGDRLEMEWDLQAPPTLTVPPLILQPLIENSVRHGSLGQTGRIVVRLSTRIQDGELVIEVRDNGQGITSRESLSASDKDHDRDSGGIGLKNINRRLRLRYDRELEIESSAGVGTCVRMRIPLSGEKALHTVSA